MFQCFTPTIQPISWPSFASKQLFNQNPDHMEQNQPITRTHQPALPGSDQRASFEFANRQDLINLKEEIVETIHHILSQRLKEFRPKKRFLKSKEVQRFLGISRTTLANLRNSKELPACRMNGIYLYDINDVEEFIQRAKK